LDNIKYNILILEDNEERRSEFLERFSNDMFTVHLCDDYDECIRLLKSNKFELIFLDNHVGEDSNCENCGLMVADWIAENKVDSQIIIHSLDLSAVSKMLKLLPKATYIPMIWQKRTFRKKMIFANEIFEKR
jgi:CheY-like chemotaxis protein